MNRMNRLPKTGAHVPHTNLFVLEFGKKHDIKKLCDAYRMDPNVDYVQPDYLMTVQSEPNDTYYELGYLWNTDKRISANLRPHGM